LGAVDDDAPEAMRSAYRRQVVAAQVAPPVAARPEVSQSQVAVVKVFPVLFVGFAVFVEGLVISSKDHRAVRS
jgi:hypothetical protein